MASLKGKAYLKDTEAWQKLQNYFDQNKNAINILELFTKDPERFSKYSLKVDTPLDGPLLVDYSKNRINDEVMELLLNLGKCIKHHHSNDKFFNCKYFLQPVKEVWRRLVTRCLKERGSTSPRTELCFMSL